MKYFLKGLPSLKEIRTNLENTTNENLKRIQTRLIPGIKEFKKELFSKKESAEKISEKAVENLVKLRNVLQNTTETQLFKIRHKIADFKSYQFSVLESMIEMMQRKDPPHQYLRELKYLLEDPNTLMRNVMKNFKFLEELTPTQTPEINDKQPMPLYQIFGKLDFINDFLNQNLKKSSFHETLEHLNILSEIEKQTRNIPFIRDTINNTQIFLKALLPIQEIEEDVLQVREILLDNKTSLHHKVFNAKQEDLEKFHLYKHLVNASEVVTNNIKYLRHTLDKMSFTDGERNILYQQNQNGTANIPSESLSSVENQTSNRRNIASQIETIGEKDDKKSDDFPLEMPDLVERVGEISKILADPGPLLPDVESMVTVTKIIPRLIPFIVADYKEEVAGWLEGTELRDSELAEVHETLVSWHHQLQGIKAYPLVPEEILRVVTIIEENNFGILSLILQLMVRAAESGGSVTLTRQDLQRLDRFLLKPEQVFPVLNDYII